MLYHLVIEGCYENAEKVESLYIFLTVESSEWFKAAKEIIVSIKTFC